MSVRTVLRLGHPLLRKPARTLTREQILAPEIQSLIQDLIDTQKASGGIGIAAPQIGESVSLAVIEFDRSNPRYHSMGELGRTIFCNAKVTVLDPTLQTFWEGCLSVPGLRGQVSRPRRIRVDYLDDKAQPQTLEAEGFVATVFQHELDHLDGVLFIDRVEARPGATQLAFTEVYDSFVASRALYPQSID